MATLGLKEMGKFLWEGREKGLPCWLSQFPISFKPKVAIAEFFWKIQRKTWYSILGLDAMPISLKNLLLRLSIINQKKTNLQTFDFKLKFLHITSVS